MVWKLENFTEAAEQLLRMYGSQPGAHPATLQELIAQEFRRFYRHGLLDGMETTTLAVEDSGRVLREALDKLKANGSLD